MAKDDFRSDEDLNPKEQFKQYETTLLSPTRGVKPGPLNVVASGKKFKFTFEEDKYLAEIDHYIRSTYEAHYSTNSGKQTIETIIENGHGEGFCMGNIEKYVGRYGKKEGRNKKDLMKLIHYAILMLYIHDTEKGK
jgi:hypothetical protein